MKNGPKDAVNDALKAATIGQAPPAAKPSAGKTDTLAALDKLVWKPKK
jgi:hypothetical protein